MAEADNEDAGDEARAQTGPRTRLMEEVAAQMDQIETELGDNFEIGRVVTIVEVKDSTGSVNLRIRANQLPWVTAGMLRFALSTVEPGGAAE